MRKNGRRLLIFAALAIFVGWMAAKIYVRLRIEGFVEGAFGFVTPVFFRDSTYYSLGYSDWSFFQIQKGMDESAVLGLLGEPLHRYRVQRSGETGWLYSHKYEDSSYHERAVLFRNGKVTKVLGGYYVD